MVKIILSGCSGKMGHVITKCVENKENCEIVAGVDINKCDAPYPIFASFSEIDVDADVIIDFSHPSVLASLLEYCKKNKIVIKTEIRYTNSNTFSVTDFLEWEGDLFAGLFCVTIHTALTVW